MKTLKYILALLSITAMISCKNNAQPEVKTVETQTKKALNPNATYAKTEFTIEGMTCAIGCAATIQKKIGAMDGVVYSVVDFDKKLAMIEYDVAKVTPNSIKETVKKVSDTYKVGDMKQVDAFSAK